MSGTTGLNRPDWERWPGAPCQPNDVCCGPATHKHTSALHTEPRPGVCAQTKNKNIHLTICPSHPSVLSPPQPLDP